MNTYIIAKDGSVKVLCIGCRQPTPITNLNIKVVEGYGGLSVDPRPKTPTGGRLGLPQYRGRRFPKVNTGPGCLACSMRYPTVLPAPKSESRKRR
jgi:hypothetical protein